MDRRIEVARGASDGLFSSWTLAPDDARSHVLVIGIDGCRPDALESADTPTLDQLRAHGTYSAHVRTQRDAPAVSGPGWASVLTGVEAASHQVDGNGDLGDIDRAHPSFLELARRAGLDVHAVAQWEGVRELIENTVADRIVLDDGDHVASRAAEMVERGADVVFVQLEDADRAGHASGFVPESHRYLAGIERVDQQIAILTQAVLARVGERWLIVVTSDHGGDARGHGARDAENQTVFLLLASPELSELGGSFPDEPARALSQLDVAPTVLAFLGIDATSAMSGVARIERRLDTLESDSR